MATLTLEEAREKMEEVLKTDPRMILTFKSKLVTDEMWEYAIAMDASLFTSCKNKTFRIASIAVSVDGFHLNNLDPVDYTGDQFTKLCQLAVEQNPKAIIAVPKEFKTDKLLAYAYSRDPELLLSEKKLSPSMVLSIIDHNPSLIQYVVRPTDDMIIHALERDPRTIVYFKDISPRVKEFYEEHFPQYASMLLHD